MDVLKLAQAHERYTQRSTQIREELEEITAQIEEQRALRAESEANFERHDAELAELQARFEDNQLAFEALDETLTNARQEARDLERAATDASFAVRGLAAKIEEYRRNIETAHDQSERVAGALEDARAELETINEQTAHTGLQDALEIRAARKRRCTRRASNSTTSPRACVTPTKRALPPSVRCSPCASASANCS